MKRFLEELSKCWIWILTFLIIFASIGVLLYFKKEEASQIGSWLSGFSATLAFLWIIAGFYLQSNELSLQRKELAMQRESLELQASELKDLNKFQSLDHIRNIVETAVNQLEGGIGELVFPIVKDQMTNISTMLKTNDLEEAWLASQKILLAYGRATSFLNSYATALKLHMQSQGIQYIENDDDKAYTFLICYIENAKNVPYLGNYYLQVKQASEMLFTLDRIYTCAHMVFLVYTKTIVSENSVKENTLEDIYKKYLEEIKGNVNCIPPVVLEYFEKIKV
jgi:hypothetical protein